MRFKNFLFIIGLFFLAFPFIARADVPDKPNLNYSVTSTSITLNWDAVNGATQYDVCFKGSDFVSSIVIEANITYENLIPNTNYYVKIRACGEVGLGSSDCSADIEGCSGFTSQKKIKTSKDISVEDLKLSYEKLNLRYQATLTKYLDYVAIDNRKELTELDSGTKEDFAEEVNTLKSELQNDLAFVKGAQDKSAIEIKYYNDLKGSFANRFNILKYKLKAYKKLNGYYKKLERYKNNFSVGDFKKDVFGTYIDKAKIYYRNYEAQVKDIVVDGTGDNYNNMKAKYKEIGAELQYRFSGLIYKKLRYLKRVEKKLKGYQDKVNSYDKLLANTITEYGNIISAAKSNYESYVDSSSNWIIKSFPPSSISIDNMKDKYNVIKDSYKSMKKLGDYKKAIYIVKGLKRINSIIKYVEEKDGKTQNFSGNSLVPVPLLRNSLINIKNKSGVYKEDIFSALGVKEAEIITGNDVNDVKEIYKQIRGYKSYKVFSYYAKGAESWYKLAAKISNLKSVVDTIGGGCPDAKIKITEAIDYAENAKNQLLDYELGDYDSIRRIHYPQFNKEYREANSKYKEAIREAKNCL